MLTDKGISSDDYARIVNASEIAGGFLRSRGHSVDGADELDAAHDAITSALSDGVLAELTDRELAKLVTTRLTASVRASERVTLALSDTTGTRSDMRRADIVSGDIATLDDAKACRAAERLSAGKYNENDAISVARARSVLSAWAGVETTVLRKRNPVPTTTANPRILADRIRKAALSGVIPITGLFLAESVARFPVSEPITRESEYAKALAEFSGTENKARVLVTTIPAILALSDNPMVSAIGFENGRYFPVSVVAVETTTTAGAWAPVATENGVIRGIRHRDSGSGIGRVTIGNAHALGSDGDSAHSAVESAARLNALRESVHRVAPVPRKARGNKPRVDVLGSLDALAASMTLDETDGLRFRTETDDADRALTAVDIIDAHTTETTRDRRGKVIGKARVNYAALSRLVGCDPKTTKAALTAWARDCETRAIRSASLEPRKLTPKERAAVAVGIARSRLVAYWDIEACDAGATYIGIPEPARLTQSAIRYPNPRDAVSVSHLSVSASVRLPMQSMESDGEIRGGNVFLRRVNYGACRGCGYVPDYCRCDS